MENTTENGPRYNHDSKKPDNKARVRVRVIPNWLSFLAISSLFLTACGGGGGESNSVQDQVDKATIQPQPSETAPPPIDTPTPEPTVDFSDSAIRCITVGDGSGMVTDLSEVERAKGGPLESDDVFGFVHHLTEQPMAETVAEAVMGGESQAALGHKMCWGDPDKGMDKADVLHAVIDWERGD